jgi:predicted metal-dependent hydrolase
MFVSTGTRELPLQFRQNHRARRYILRLTSDGSARVTVPRGGSIKGALDFARGCGPWLERQMLRRASAHTPWKSGHLVPWRGTLEPLTVVGQNEADASNDRRRVLCHVRFGDACFTLQAEPSDLRPAVERHIRNAAERELPLRVWALAAIHNAEVERVTIRDQRSRWGSCSRRRTISLNWRLIQCPPEVRDYIILHELAHLKHMDHSPSFWLEVRRLCPNYQSSEGWLKTTGRKWFRFG